MDWYGDSHFKDKESGISGWGFVPTPEQQADRNTAFIMELQIQGYSLAALLPTRKRKELVNWRHGDPEQYMETHWQMFEPGYESKGDELTANDTLEKINAYREKYENVWCVEPSEDMKFEAGCYEELPEGHGLVAVMVRDLK